LGLKQIVANNFDGQNRREKMHVDDDDDDDDVCR